MPLELPEDDQTSGLTTMTGHLKQIVFQVHTSRPGNAINPHHIGGIHLRPIGLMRLGNTKVNGIHDERCILIRGRNSRHERPQRV